MKFYPFILALLPIVIILIISEISKRSIVTEEAYATVDTVSYTIDSFTPIDSVSEIMNAEPKN
jgi:hypothetical protein